jgi:hypothetical protein
MIATTAATATVAGVRRAPVVRPKNAGPHWKGVKHGSLMDMILAGCELRGWRPGEPRLHLCKTGADFAMSVLLPGGPNRWSCSVPSIGVLASNSGFRRLRFFAGAELDGTAVVCASKLGAKYVKGSTSHPDFDLAREVRAGLDWFSHCDAVNQTARETGGEECRVSADECMSLLFRAARDEMTPWSRIGLIDQMNRTRGNNLFLWDVLLNFNRVAAANPAQDQMPQMLDFRNLVMESANWRKAVAV